MEAIKKFVVIGPESTGKSTLCKQLAEYYDTVWVPEYAREYLETNANDYTYNDLIKIAQGQLNAEDDVISKFEKRNLKLFIDTDMYVMKVWCEFVFDKCSNWILNRIAERKYEGYLLCDTDLPWVKDNLREYPDLKMREKLFHHYEDIMINQNVPWIKISGNYEERLNKAKRFVESI